jgi:ABC-type antimicrobial peptide transport system permease subunit
VDGVLLKPLAFEEPEGLERVLARSSFPDMQDWVLIPSIRRAVSEWSSEIPVANLGSMTNLVAASARGRRFHLFVLGSFAAEALLLAAVGLYGLLSHGVSERRSELGVHLALGADPRALSLLVLRQGLKLSVLGLVLGSFLAYVLSRLMTSFLFGVSGTGPALYLAVAATLLVTVSLASFLPAYRASRVDPLASIRAD